MTINETFGGTKPPEKKAINDGTKPKEQEKTLCDLTRCWFTNAYHSLSGESSDRSSLDSDSEHAVLLGTSDHSREKIHSSADGDLPRSSWDYKWTASAMLRGAVNFMNQRRADLSAQSNNWSLEDRQKYIKRTADIVLKTAANFMKQHQADLSAEDWQKFQQQIASDVQTSLKQQIASDVQTSLKQHLAQNERHRQQTTARRSLQRHLVQSYRANLSLRALLALIARRP